MFSYDPARELGMIDQYYERAVAMFNLPDDVIFRSVPDFSAWSAADHLVHLARTNTQIIRSVNQLLEGRGSEGAPTRLGAFLLLAGGIPRKRAQADPAIHPPSQLDRGQARVIWGESVDHLTALRGRLPEISRARARFKHQIFGLLSAAEWTRFAAVHTRHHLRIAEDVVHIRCGAH